MPPSSIGGIDHNTGPLTQTIPATVYKEQQAGRVLADAELCQQVPRWRRVIGMFPSPTAATEKDTSQHTKVSDCDGNGVTNAAKTIIAVPTKTKTDVDFLSN